MSPSYLTPGINVKGFATAIKDYSEKGVIEEVVANSYDADASVVLLLIDEINSSIEIIDNGSGFDKDTIELVVQLGGGTKTNVPFSKSKRPYLGSYGFGIKSTFNIARRVEIFSYNKEENIHLDLDWNKIEDAFNNANVWPLEIKKQKTSFNGTILKIQLKNPIDKLKIEDFQTVLSNLPNNEKFKIYIGRKSDAHNFMPNNDKEKIKELEVYTRKLFDTNLLLSPVSALVDLESCVVHQKSYKEDQASIKIYHGRMVQGSPTHIKPGLRGIYVMVNGRLLKNSFTETKYTGNISKWKKFESGLRVILSIDWLRDQITLSRDGISFSNEMLEQQFKKILQKGIYDFISPKLKHAKHYEKRKSDEKFKQRLEQANSRLSNREGHILTKWNEIGFNFIPQTDAELAVLISQPNILKKINDGFQLIDYNDQAEFDCLIYDHNKKSFLNVELEPDLKAWLNHNNKDKVELIITWTLGKWKVGQSFAGKGRVVFKLVNHSYNLNGYYTIEEFSSEKSNKPKNKYDCVVLQEIYEKGN